MTSRISAVVDAWADENGHFRNSPSMQELKEALSEAIAAEIDNLEYLNDHPKWEGNLIDREELKERLLSDKEEKA